MCALVHVGRAYEVCGVRVWMSVLEKVPCPEGRPSSSTTLKSTRPISTEFRIIAAIIPALNMVELVTLTQSRRSGCCLVKRKRAGLSSSRACRLACSLFDRLVAALRCLFSFRASSAMAMRHKIHALAQLLELSPGGNRYTRSFAKSLLFWNLVSSLSRIKASSPPSSISKKLALFFLVWSFLSIFWFLFFLPVRTLIFR